MNILALAGSIRSAASNSALVRTAIIASPSEMNILPYRGLIELPHFYSERDGRRLDHVVNFRAHLKASQGLLICNSDYSLDTYGMLKNALNWLLMTGELVGMPVGLLQDSQVGHLKCESLNEMLACMGTVIVPEACVTVNLLDFHHKNTIYSQLLAAQTFQHLLAEFAKVVAARNTNDQS